MTLSSSPDSLPGPSSYIAVAVETCYTDKYKGLGSHGGASLRQQHFSMNTHTHTHAPTRRHTLPVPEAGRHPRASSPTAAKEGMLCKQTIAVELLPNRRTSARSVPRATVVENWKHFKCGGEFITRCVKAVTLIYAWRSSVVI